METHGPWSGADNSGGGCYLLLVRHDHVEHVPVPESEWADPLTLLPGKDYIAIIPSEGTLSFKEDQDPDSGDDAFRVQGSLILPKNHPARLELQRRTIGNRYILIYVDRNGTAILIGNSDEPVRLLFGRDTGEDFGDRNHVQISFSQTFRYPAPFYKDFEADQPGEIQIPGSPSTGGGGQTQIMQGRFAYDTPFAYMGLAPLTAAEGDSLWKIVRNEFTAGGVLVDTRTALNVTWTNFASHNY